MSLGLVTIQLGKAGYIEGSRENIRRALDLHKNIKITQMKKNKIVIEELHIDSK